MSITEAAIQGIIQGLTEFLPVSSSGHLSLYQYFTNQSGEAGAAFSLLLHFGTLIAVFVAFREVLSRLTAEFFHFCKELVTGRADLKHPNEERRTILLLLFSLLPLWGTFLFKDLLHKTASDNDILIEGICFLITGALLLSADRAPKGHRRAKQMTYRSALAIGAVQAVAPLPGISSSGSTLSIALMLGLDVKFAVNFSFLMGIPAILAALLLDAKEFFNGTFAFEPAVIITGLAASVLFGLLAIRMVRWLAQERRLRYFGYYTLTLGCIVVLIGLFELATGNAVQAAATALLAP